MRRRGQPSTNGNGAVQQPGRGHFHVFRYSRWDAVLAACGLVNTALLTTLALRFDTLPLWALTLAFLMVVHNYGWTMNAVEHNFIHNPYFASRWLNRFYGLLLSTDIGVPQTFSHHYHLTHHWGNNDMKAANGSTKDLTSSYRHGHDGKREGF